MYVCVSAGDHAEVAGQGKQGSQDVHQRACSRETQTDPGLCELLPAGKGQVWRHTTERGESADAGRDTPEFQRTLFVSESCGRDAHSPTAAQCAGPLHCRKQSQFTCTFEASVWTPMRQRKVLVRCFPSFGSCIERPYRGTWFGTNFHDQYGLGTPS